jgi:hypothetical protein
MIWLIAAAVVFIALVLFVAKLKSPVRSPDSYPYVKIPTLFTPAERSLLGVLEQAVGADFRIFGKVRVADVVSVCAMSNRSAYQTAFNRINAKHFDFILCNKSDLSVVSAIELNDRSHEQTNRRERDKFLEAVCKAAALPFIRLQARGSYSVVELRETVHGALHAHMDGKMADLAEPVTPQIAAEAGAPLKLGPAADSTTRKLDSVNKTTETPLCPQCSAPMVRREAKRGANAGDLFWGCSAFPKCRGMLSIS